MNLPTIDEFDFTGKSVIIRSDFDFGKSLQTGILRIESVLPTLRNVLKTAKRIILLAHRGRPEGKVDENLSLEPLVDFLDKRLDANIVFLPKDLISKLNEESVNDARVVLIENLRFWPEEEEGDESFAKKFAELGEVYINEAFSVSHRRHSSLLALPTLMKESGKPTLFGNRFVEEVQNLDKILTRPERPTVLFLGGVKEDKLQHIEELMRRFDRVLVGGRLPEYIHDASPLWKDDKVVVAGLIADREDITVNSIEKFESEIARANTIVVAGPAGKYEDEAHAAGTARIMQAVTESDAYKVAAGGDTEEALSVLGLSDKFDWISVGGGATLEYLAKGTLPVIQALLD